jgi:glycosyltransferase involved in cell wall biosynthesis
MYPGIEIEPLGVAIAARRRAIDPGNEGENEPITVIHMEAFQPLESRVRALDVLGALRGRSVDARLQVVGRFEPGEAGELRVEARRRGAAAHVDLIDTGSTSVDVPKLLAAASMFLSTASGGSGGLSRPVLQACAVGTPVLSADLPAIREIARLLPGVTMLPLGADDVVWADTARVLTAVPPSLDNRRESLRAFVRSPFTADTWQREVTALWS